MALSALITGGAGFIGSFLVEALLDRGYSVRVLDNLDAQVHPPGARFGHIPSHCHADVDMHRQDVRDQDAVRRAVDGIDIVFHLAAQVGVGQSMYEIKRYVDVNSGGTAALLQTIVDTQADVSYLLVASSMSVYGEGAYTCPDCGPVFPQGRTLTELRSHQWDPACPVCGKVQLAPVPTPESKPIVPGSIYAITKRSQEEMCLGIGRAYDMAATAFRCWNAYGPRQSLSNPYTGVAAIFSSRLKNNRAPLIYEDGQQIRDFVHVQDVVQAMVLAAENPAKSRGQVFNVGSGQPITIYQVAQAIAAAMGSDIEPVIVHRYREGDIRHNYPDISKIVDQLGYRPQANFKERIAELIAWSTTQETWGDLDAAHQELTRQDLLQ